MTNNRPTSFSSFDIGDSSFLRHWRGIRHSSFLNGGADVGVDASPYEVFVVVEPAAGDRREREIVVHYRQHGRLDQTQLRQRIVRLREQRIPDAVELVEYLLDSRQGQWDGGLSERVHVGDGEIGLLRAV